MITAQMAKEIVENVPNVRFQAELETVSSLIKCQAELGRRSAAIDLSEMKNKDKIVKVLSDSGFKVTLFDHSSIKESTFSFNKKEPAFDIISWE